MARHHLIISGTGRAGTTFLVQLLTEVGLDTGFETSTSNIFENCNAGMERDLRGPDAPYVVKSPFLCDDLDEIIAGGDVMIDHALVPIRDLNAAAESRRSVVAKSAMNLEPDRVPGGLWATQDPRAQEAVLAEKHHRLMYSLAKHDIPMTLLHFPRFINDAAYLYAKLKFALNDTDYESFQKAFRAVCRPELVHDFAPAIAAAAVSTHHGQVQCSTL